MRPVLAVFDGFFRDPEQVRRDILAGPFADVCNPVDGVSYPDINIEVPPYVSEYVVTRLEEIFSAKVNPKVIFARLTRATGRKAPHAVHSDRIMGQYSAHVYISREWPEGAGTSFWTHVTEGSRHDENTDIDLIAKDYNDLSQWEKTINCQGLFNRVLIHDACFWHCAEPIGGWGDSPENGRVVLTCFFDVVEG